MSTITNTPTSTSNSSSKRKSPVQGRQDQIKSRMLEMAEEEHKQKIVWNQNRKKLSSISPLNQFLIKDYNV
jgi:hypothetical protein